MNDEEFSLVFSEEAETHELARQILSQHAKSFAWAAAFLPPSMKSAAAIAYAFCRQVDDAVDEATNASEGAQRLASIEAMLEGRAPASPLVSAYVQLCERLGIGLGPARDLILGARSDLGPVRLAKDSDLMVYCYRVAGTVGLMMCGILGVRDRSAAEPAVNLGIAMQLTNISRDVLEDAKMGRVYLPEARLAAHGISSDALVAGVNADTIKREVRQGVARVVQELLALADLYYRSAAAGFRMIPPRQRLAIVVASGLYRAIGDELCQRNYDALRGRVRVSAMRKLWLTFRGTISWVAGIFAPPVPLEPGNASTRQLLK